MTFVAYVQARPDTVDASGIFYVGKGTPRRAKDLSPRNPYHASVVTKHGKRSVLVGTLECSSEKISLELERGLIKCLKRMGVALTNMTEGGDGISGYKHTEEWKSHHSSVMRGKPSPTKGVVKSTDHRSKISKTLKERAPWKGKTHTVAARAKMGVNKGLVWVTNGLYRVRVCEWEVDRYLTLGFSKGIKL